MNILHKLRNTNARLELLDALSLRILNSDLDQ